MTSGEAFRLFRDDYGFVCVMMNGGVMGAWESLPRNKRTALFLQLLDVVRCALRRVSSWHIPD